MSRELLFPRPVGSDQDYWLCRCEGFRVETPEGRLGVVVEVHYEGRIDRPHELVVCGGVFGNRFMVVPAGDVLEVVPREERLLVRTRAAPRREPLARLRAHLLGTLRGAH